MKYVSLAKHRRYESQLRDTRIQNALLQKEIRVLWEWIETECVHVHDN